MKIRSLVNKVKTFPKSVLALMLFALFSVPLVAGMVTAANQVLMEGNTTVLNVSAGQTTYSDSVDLKVDEVAQVQVWHHNREMPEGEKAKNTVVKVSIPSTPGKSQIITGSTTTDNGNAVSDTTLVNLSLDKARLEYIPGTAKFKYNKGAATGDASCKTGLEVAPARCYATVSISDSVVTTGVNLDAVRGGPLNGCNAYHETVTVQVRSKADVVSVNKYVRHAGQTSADWKTSTTAKPGDDIEYMIKFKNEGNTVLNNVMVGDNMPQFNKYVSGSTKIQNSSFPSGVSAGTDNITKGGINVGNYAVGSVGYVLIKVKIDPISAYPQCTNYDTRNVGIVQPEGMNEFYNTAQVTIKVECAPKPQEPKYSCDSLKAEKVGDRMAKFTASASASGGAVISKYNYAFGDGQTFSTAANTASHTYANYGEYTATVSVDFTVDGKTVSKTGPQCKVTVKFEKPEEPVKPVYSCDSLKAQKLGDKKVRFTGSATAKNGAVIQNYIYEFGDGGKTTTNSNTVDYTYAKYGEYTAQLTVEFMVNNQVVKKDGPQCKVTVKFEKPEEPKKPVYSCDSLSVEKTGGRSIEATVSATAKNGAEIKRYIFSFGDDSEELVTDKETVKHTYAKDGKYVVRVKVQVAVGDEVKTIESDNCAKVVEFETPETPEEPKEPETPGKLPETGVGGAITAFMAASGLGSLGYTLVNRRRG